MNWNDVDMEPGVVDADRHGSTKGLTQPTALKGKENNLETITKFLVKETHPWDKDGGCKAHEVETGQVP